MVGAAAAGSVELVLPARVAGGWGGVDEQRARERLWRELCAQDPPRPGVSSWTATSQAREQVIARLAQAPFPLADPRSQRSRQWGISHILTWLQTQPGDTWQQRWTASGIEAEVACDWRLMVVAWLAQQKLASATPGERQAVGSGLMPLVCADVIRPGMAWLLNVRTLRDLAAAMGRTRDSGGFATLAAVGRGAVTTSEATQAVALRQIAVIMAAKGGVLADISVGDCLQLLSVAADSDAGKSASSPHFYQLLHAAGVFSVSAPATVRVFRTQGQLTAEQLIDRYGLQCRPMRDLLVDYLQERRPGVDYSTLRALAHILGKLFWRDLEIHHPGISCLRIGPQAAAAWRQRLATKTVRTRKPDGQLTETRAERGEVLNLLTVVRAFYLDINEWAVEDPARWGPWAAPCPIRSKDLTRQGHLSRRKARMDQRTRERMPILPLLVAATTAAAAQAKQALTAAAATTPGEVFIASGQRLRRAVMTTKTSSRVWAEDPDTGQRRDLTLEEHRAFWTWATVEVLRHTGIRIEELTELSHHSLIQYRLPATGELIPLVQITPSKTDAERLLPVD